MDNVELIIDNNQDNVLLVVDDGFEIVELHIQDGAFSNNIDDSAGDGDYIVTWSANKLYHKFLSLEGVSKEYIDELLLDKVDKQDGMGLSETSFTQEEKDKLLGVAVGATKNALDSFLLDRGNHTGVQPKDSVDGLVDDLNTIYSILSTLTNDNGSVLVEIEKIKSDVMELSNGQSSLEDSNSKLATRVSSLETKLSGHISYVDGRLLDIERSVNVVDNKVDVLYTRMDGKVDKVSGKQLSTNDFTSSYRTKLTNIQEGATKNSADSFLLDRKNHTGVQPLSSISGLNEALNTKVDKVDGMGLSATSFTQAEKDKLAALQGSRWRGVYKDEASLPQTANSGDYADVDGGVGEDIYRVIWDGSDGKWIRVGGVSTALTDAQIKQQYENNPDTNAFTDVEKNKLNSIADEATKNLDDNYLLNRVNHTGVQPINSIDGLSDSLDTKVDKVVGMGLSSNNFTDTLKSKLDNVQDDATKNRDDSLNADKVHTHIISDIVGLQSQLEGKASVSDVGDITTRVIALENTLSKLIYSIYTES